MAWAPDYASLSEVKSFLNIEFDDSRDDSVIQLAISAASRAIDRACNRQFGKDDAPTTRYYTAQYSNRHGGWAVQIDDLMTNAGLAVKYDSANDQTYSGVVTGYRPLPLNALVTGRPWTSMRLTSGVGPLQDAVAVTAAFGWTAVPAGIKQATLLQASRFIARRDSPYGIAGSPDNGGSELRLLSRLDPDVEVSIAPYRRTWGAVR